MADIALDIHISGIVQGVGFRPFVYRMAQKHQVKGWVLNGVDGVRVHAEGPEERVDAFVLDVHGLAPAAARVQEMTLDEVPPEGFGDFQIRFSEDEAAEKTTLVSPDLATCDECLHELFDPADRRFRYPFINCTNCGPRFTIIRDLPYDRASTSMASFEMCPDCAAEYADPADRRFHAQPDACWDCGPHLSFAVLPNGETPAPYDQTLAASRAAQETLSLTAAPHGSAGGARDGLPASAGLTAADSPWATGDRWDSTPLSHHGRPGVLGGDDLDATGLPWATCEGPGEPSLAPLGAACVDLDTEGDGLAASSAPSASGAALPAPSPGGFIWGNTREHSDAILAEAVRVLRAGGIVAVKGLGGFHLCCDAANPQALARLRQRKRREGKAFAVMFVQLDDVAAVAQVSPDEAALLQSPARPIVLLRKRPDVPLAPGLADGLPELGCMLPATPLQHLLLHDFGGMLVMTSGNVHDEPICIDDADARERLSGIADCLIGHDRPILARYDDSVVRVLDFGELGSAVQVIRRARGYAPLPIPLFCRTAEERLSRPDACAESGGTGGPCADHGAHQSVPQGLASRRAGSAAGLQHSPASTPLTHHGQPGAAVTGPEESPREPTIFATGPEQKVTFCLTRPGEAFVSQHIGDLENAATFDAWLEAKATYEHLLRLHPAAIACDQHPGYLTSKWAEEQLSSTFELAGQSTMPRVAHGESAASSPADAGSPSRTPPALPRGAAVSERASCAARLDASVGSYGANAPAAVRPTEPDVPPGSAQASARPPFGRTAERKIQHHHAHIAAVMAENNLEGPVCGFAFDGTGAGADGAVWGGEVLLANLQTYERFANLAYFPLPGGAAAVKHPLRTAYGLLWACDLLEHPGAADALAALGPQTDMLQNMIDAGLNCPQTSSMGRLFDAVSALLGICREPRYEGEAAIALEAVVPSADRSAEQYAFALVKNQATHESTALDTSVVLLDPEPVVRAVLDDLVTGVPREVIARRFHDAVVEVIVQMAQLVEAAYGIRDVTLGGGVFMNRYLMEHAVPALAAAGFNVAMSRDLPPNDGAVSYGQAIVTLANSSFDGVLEG